MKGQGATEYLVLLAVVLIIALVGIALLGFFPGTASDAQRTQSELYWESASPIAITEWGAKVYALQGDTYGYLRFRNNAAYPLRLTGIIAPDGGKVSTFASAAGCGITSGIHNISEAFYLAPGEEKYLAWAAAFGTACDWQFKFTTSATSGVTIGGATSVCANSSSSPGNVVLNSMGLEYISYIEGQQITKRQIGRQVVIKCQPPQ